MFLFLILFKQAYFLSVKPPAALGAAATIRDWEPLYDQARTYFKQTYANTILGQPTANRCDRSADMPRPGGLAPTVLPPTMTNADQPEHGLNKPKLNPNLTIIYQAKPANPGCFGSPGRRWRPVGYTGNYQYSKLEPNNQTNQLTANHTNNRQLPVKQPMPLTNSKTI